MSHLSDKDFYDRDLVRKAHQEQLMKGLYGNDIFKAEGSRGGKVIGHTKTGKPIYENKHPRDYKDFSSTDHSDAGKIHDEKGDQYLSKQHHAQGKHVESEGSVDLKVGKKYKRSDGHATVQKVYDDNGKKMVDYIHHGIKDTKETQTLNGFLTSLK